LTTTSAFEDTSTGARLMPSTWTAAIEVLATVFEALMPVAELEPELAAVRPWGGVAAPVGPSATLKPA